MTNPAKAETRRGLLKAFATLPALVAGGAAAPAAGATLPPTPSCEPGAAQPTRPQTAGPYFTPKSPQRASLLEPGVTGRRLILTGRVLRTDCRPVAKALIDVWQADAAGAYDNAGYRLRGHLFSDEAGSYRLETIVPGVYPGRTPHIHLKVQPPEGAVLTTQLYFPGEAARNRRDFIYDPSLLVEVTAEEPVMTARFDFVIAVR